MKMHLWIQKIPIGLIRGYRYLISPFLPPSCRFTPTCSRYAIEAIQAHGTLRGLFLACGRIFRCHPFCDGGYDPVPPVHGDECGCHNKSKDSKYSINKTRDNQSGVIS